MDLHVWGSRCGMRSWHLIGSSFLLMMASLRRMHGYGGRPNRSPGTWPLLPKGTRKWPVRSIPVAECTYCSISLVELWWYLQSPWISTPITSTISSFLHQIGSFLRGLCLTRVRSTSVEYHWALWCKRRSEPPRLGLRDQAWTFNELSGEGRGNSGYSDAAARHLHHPRPTFRHQVPVCLETQVWMPAGTGVELFGVFFANTCHLLNRKTSRYPEYTFIVWTLSINKVTLYMMHTWRYIQVLYICMCNTHIISYIYIYFDIHTHTIFYPVAHHPGLDLAVCPWRGWQHHWCALQWGVGAERWPLFLPYCVLWWCSTFTFRVHQVCVWISCRHSPSLPIQCS